MLAAGCASATLIFLSGEQCIYSPSALCIPFVIYLSEGSCFNLNSTAMDLKGFYFKLNSIAVNLKCLCFKLNSTAVNLKCLCFKLNSTVMNQKKFLLQIE
ncbi:hypothetical protein ASJ81_17340 [Methanosarcina spelaei]|uniref:Uncharacterized protein n=1 Tax=Methanosarcina spelaei TaxID=1036679 RepID=A0A2A2HVN3_9EURY|nr:hypothetical protein ASJ81_17340 [Methanosarcina spelaei]